MTTDHRDLISPTHTGRRATNDAVAGDGFPVADRPRLGWRRRTVRRRLKMLLIVWVVAVAALIIPVGAASAVTVVPDGGFVVSGTGADAKRQVDIAHDAGARWISLSTSWEALEPQPDVYPTGTWAELQDRIAYARSRAMNVELRLANAPGWASGRSGGDDPPTPAHLADYADFLKVLSGTLSGGVDAYSPWNEPNREAFWNPVDPDAFTALQKVAYPAIKSGDPTATVLYGPVVGRYASQNSGYVFLRRSYQLGAKGSFDAIGWNGYPGGPPESDGPVENGIPAANTLPAQIHLRGLIDQYDPGRKVWIMEFGWSTCTTCDVSAANGASEATQADYLTRAFDYRRRYLSGYVERMFWYQVRDTGTNRTVWEQNEGVVRNDYSPKPALAAFAALGVEDADGTLPATGGGTSSGNVPPTTLPPAAARLGLPAAGRSVGGGRTALGRPSLTLRSGVFTLRLRILVRGGRSTVRIDGFRAKRWKKVSVVRVTRSGRLTLRIRDRGYVGFRIRATVPGRKGFRVGRVVRVPKKYLRVRPTILSVGRVSMEHGALRVPVRVLLRNRASKVRVDGLRARRWHRVTVKRVPASGRLTVTVHNRHYARLRVRATVPGRAGFHGARVVTVPRRFRTR